MRYKDKILENMNCGHWSRNLQQHLMSRLRHCSVIAKNKAILNTNTKTVRRVGAHWLTVIF